MQGIARRLRDVRVSHGLSLRGMQTLLAETAGESISHDSIRHYENGTRSVPALYLLAVCRALDVDPSWLLLGLGRGPAPDAADEAWEDWAPRVSAAGTAWVEFVRHAREAGLPAPVIGRSWQRSMDAGVDARPAVVTFRRIDVHDLARRQAAASHLLDAARPQLDWLVGKAAAGAPAVASLADAHGVVLSGTAHPDRLTAAWGLTPGIDWSEAVMGTNAIGTALSTGRIVAVLGPEHYMEHFHGAAGIAAPIRVNGAVRAAIALSIPVAAAHPALAMAVGFAAHATEIQLQGPAGDAAATVVVIP